MPDRYAIALLTAVVVLIALLLIYAPVTARSEADAARSEALTSRL